MKKLRVPLTDEAGNPVPGMYIMREIAEVAPSKPLCSCPHFGDKLNLPRVPCLNCRGTLLDLFVCQIYGECTPTKPAAGIACCAGCPHNPAKK